MEPNIFYMLTFLFHFRVGGNKIKEEYHIQNLTDTGLIT
jgi:hypothetical protein